MPRFGLCVSGIACALLLLGIASAAAEPVSEGHPHKWETVDKGMVDFLNDGFELKAVVYDDAEKSDLPDVHYFLQKKAQLVRCDFRKRGETSVYWCAQLVKPRQQ